MRPALVMADVSIPGRNGYEICEFVKNHPDMKDTPVVLLVPAFEPFDEERARSIGVNQHLTKPFQSIRTLIATVKGLLEAHPPKITTPLSSGPLNNFNAASAALIKPAAAPTPEVVAEAAPAVKVPRENVRPTQPFPDEPLEEPAEAESESLLEETEEALVVEAPSVTFEPELEPAIEAESVQPTDAITDAVTQPNVKVLGDAETLVTEPVQSEEAPAPPPPAIQPELASDLDHVLDLDDVLTWPPAPTYASQPEPSQAAAPAPEAVEAAEAITIPQTVIDEIVNRVVAQLSEKLTANLAAQIAPEVAEIVKQQAHQVETAPSTFVPPANNQDSDSLLDLD